MRHPKLVSLLIITVALTACSNRAAPAAEAMRLKDVTMQRFSSSSSVKKFLPRSSSYLSHSSHSSHSSYSSSSSFPPRTDLKIPILVYHHIRDTKPWPPSTWSWKMSVSPKKFEEQMQWLVDRGYTTVNLDTMNAIMDGSIYGPEKPVVITFDDNQLSSYDVAVPIMTARNQTATFYLIVKYLDDKNFIGRAQIPDLIAKGMDVQSHTMTHANLTNLSRDQLTWQLTESRRVLAEATGKPVTHVAYPLTAHSQTVRDAAKAAGYTTGTIMDPRPAVMTSDRFKLPRIMMTDTTDLTKILP